MGAKMADTDVANDLKSIQQQIDYQDRALSELKDVSIQQVQLMEKMVAHDERFAEYRERTDQQLEKMWSRIDENRVFVLKATGAILAGSALIGAIVGILKIVEKI